MGERKHRMNDPLVSAWVEHLQNWYIDSVMHLTFKKGNPNAAPVRRTNERVKFLLRDFFSAIKFKGNYLAVIERDAEGNVHLHVLFESGSVANETLRSWWYERYGFAEIHSCRMHSCDGCEMQRCREKRIGGGCSDYRYVVRKMAHDGSDGGSYFDRMRARPAA